VRNATIGEIVPDRQIRPWLGRFSLGTPILALLLAAAVAGIAVWRIPQPARPDLLVWSFDQRNVDIFRGPPSLLDEFHENTGITAGVSLMGEMGENVRLASAFMSGAAGSAAPDLCEIEINSIGQFLRPPAAGVGLLPLNHFLAQSGWDKRIVPSRFAPWSKFENGSRIIFGVPLDVHPIAIAYRKDLFDSAGVNLAATKNWSDFHEKCLAFQRYWSSRGFPDRRAIALSPASAEQLLEMLLQRHINLIDQQDQLHFNDARTLDTLVFYARMVTGPGSVSGEISPGVQWTHDLAAGNVCAAMIPDWKADDLRQYAPDTSAQIAMMPLPRFDPDDSPTSTAGGTMVGICRTCPNPQAAWKLLEYLYLGEDSQRAHLAARNSVLPAIPEYWTDPAYHRDLMVTLAPQVPQRIVTPYTFAAQLALAEVMHRAVEYEAAHPDDSGLPNACARWLSEAQQDIQRRIEFGNLQ
jgi:ABC-type glycerol-3-phosphate transport system substrate-binding protein